MVKLGQIYLICVEEFLVYMQLSAKKKKQTKKKKKKKKKKNRPLSDAVTCDFRSYSTRVVKVHFVEYKFSRRHFEIGFFFFFFFFSEKKF